MRHGSTLPEDNYYRKGAGQREDMRKPGECLLDFLGRHISSEAYPLCNVDPRRSLSYWPQWRTPSPILKTGGASLLEKRVPSAEIRRVLWIALPREGSPLKALLGHCQAYVDCPTPHGHLLRHGLGCFTEGLKCVLARRNVLDGEAALLIC